MKEILTILFKQTPKLRERGEWEKADKLQHDVYADSPLMYMLDRRAKEGLPESALFTDIDNTFHKLGYEKK